MFKLDRLGRDDVDPLLVRKECDRYGVRLRALAESIDSPFEFGFRVLIAAEESRNPGSTVVADLEREMAAQRPDDQATRERARLRAALTEFEAQHTRLLDASQALKARLSSSEGADEGPVEPIDTDVLTAIARRLDGGLSIEDRATVVRQLVRIIVHTEVTDARKKEGRAVIGYRFPERPSVAVETHTGRGVHQKPTPAAAPPHQGGIGGHVCYHVPLL